MKPSLGKMDVIAGKCKGPCADDCCLRENAGRRISVEFMPAIASGTNERGEGAGSIPRRLTRQKPALRPNEGAFAKDKCSLSYFTSVTGTSANCITRWATEPMKKEDMVLSPRVPMTMAVHPLFFAQVAISLPGEPKTTVL